MKRLRIIGIFGGLGLLIAIVVFIFAFWETSAQAHVDVAASRTSQILMLIFCPPSIELMAMETAGAWLTRIIIMLVIAVQNVVIYSLIGALFTWIWEHLRPCQSVS
ncbi:MAG: hypothetical protein ACREHG_08650 [Candidatus Saccharimonadales bacterium]